MHHIGEVLVEASLVRLLLECAINIILELEPGLSRLVNHLLAFRVRRHPRVTGGPVEGRVRATREVDGVLNAITGTLVQRRRFLLQRRCR